jgi:hypothetical protein
VEALGKCKHQHSKNPRNRGCVRCGRIFERDRDSDFERQLTELAARNAGKTRPISPTHMAGDTAGLDEYADFRAHPGGVRFEGRDWLEETRQELADARNYLCWELEEYWGDYLDGDPVAAEVVASRMDALQKVIEAWHALRPAA